MHSRPVSSVCLRCSKRHSLAKRLTKKKITSVHCFTQPVGNQSTYTNQTVHSRTLFSLLPLCLLQLICRQVKWGHRNIFSPIIGSGALANPTPSSGGVAYRVLRSKGAAIQEHYRAHSRSHTETRNVLADHSLTIVLFSIFRWRTEMRIVRPTEVTFSSNKTFLFPPFHQRQRNDQ